MRISKRKHLALLVKYKIWQIMPVKVVYHNYTINVYHCPGTDSICFMGRNNQGRNWVTNNWNNITSLCYD